ncbi:hypothetical protein SPI_01580 [Niveomyces insectorum RCEF 264]|uniref:F-box domain-containing protein n=1 Tax=Niveomyces insectorum RCEF 264 TaxID=1081102 RepID=A0A167Z2P9_9HYPO|nr:hypothetical protein SPI_01580 [Niveomyces insectorum RCEF 264]
MPFSLPATAGKKRALPLDLHDIANAIHNLPTDSSALLPSPLPSAVFDNTSRSTSSSSAGGTAAANTAPTAPTASDAVHERLVAFAVKAGAQRIRHDLARGRYEPKHLGAAVDKGEAAEANGTDDNEDQLLQELDAARKARNARTVDVLNAAGLALDGDAVQVLLQSWLPVPAPSASGHNNNNSSNVPPAYIACKQGTVWAWTKYYKGNWNNSAVAVGTTVSGGASPPGSAGSLHFPQTRETAIRHHPEQPHAKRLKGAAPTASRSGVAYGVDHQVASSTATPEALPRRRADVVFDLLSSVASCPDLVAHLCTFLDFKDVLVLYRVSRVFKRTIDDDLESNVLHLARVFVSPETLSIFPWRLYKKATTAMVHDGAETPPAVPGPAGAAVAAPTLRYVHMLISRERKVRDIVACLARAGHRLPRPTATAALKKLWLLMDVPTNRSRLALLRNEQLFTDGDLLVLTMFQVKLTLYCHDPLLGPSTTTSIAPTGLQLAPLPGPLTPAVDDVDIGDDNDNAANANGDANGHTNSNSNNSNANNDGDVNGSAEPTVPMFDAVLHYRRRLPRHLLVRLLLGQRGGLHVLWSFMRSKQYRTVREMVELLVRYDYVPPRLPENVPDHVNGDGGFDFNSTEQLDNNVEQLRGFAFPTSRNRFAMTAAQQAALAHVVRSVPITEWGTGHLEGWGLGGEHLLRPDELIPLEAGRRRRVHPESHLDLRLHLPFLVVWGNRDFRTGVNLVPTLEEMYMSDSEEEEEGGEDTEEVEMEMIEKGKGKEEEGVVKMDEDKENMGKKYEDDDDDDGLFNLPANLENAFVPEDYLARRCGNVPFQAHEWQPWQVLKAQWATLSMEDKLQVWWVGAQGRLKRQPWAPAPAAEAVIAGDIASDHAGANEDGIGGSEQVADGTGNSANNGDEGHATSNGVQGSNGAGEDVSMDDVMMEGDDGDYELFLDPFDDDDDDDDDVGGGGLNGGPAPGGPTSFDDFMAQATNPDAGADDVGADDVGADDAVADNPFAAFAGLPRSHHDQDLIAAYVDSAAREHDAVDAALTAQADASYSTAELDLWEHALGLTMLAPDDPATGGPTAGEEEGDEAADSGGDVATEDDEANSESGDDTSDDDDNNAPAGMQPPPPPPTDVLMPGYGAPDDVLGLVQRIFQAEAAAAAAEAEAAVAAADTTTGGRSRKQARRYARRVQRLQRKLEAKLQAEVFALDF